MSAQLVASSLSFSHGPNPIISSTTFTVAPADRLAVIGPNGAGKTTLLRLLAGQLEPESGHVTTNPPGASVVLHRQVVDDALDAGVHDWLLHRAGVRAVESEFDAAASALATEEHGSADRYDRALAALLRVDPGSFDERARAALDEVALGHLRATQPVGSLSGGQRTRLQLAALRLIQADVLLLDEPTNDLDADGLDLLETVLGDRRGATVVVSHDRAFLAGWASGVLELDGHHHTVTRYEGGYDEWERQRRIAREHADEAWRLWTTQRDDLKARAQRERQWSAAGVRGHKNSDEPDRNLRQAKIERSEQLAGKASRTERALERHEANRVDQPWIGWELRLDFASVPTAGSEVAHAHGAVVERGEFRLGPVDVVLGSGDRVLLTGPNGGGKSTLLDLLLGRLQPTEGSAGPGPGAVIGHMNQGRAVFGDGPLLETFMERSGLEHAPSRSRLAKLGLGAEEIARPVAELSPGEQTRAILGLFAAKGVNTLVLDEPTNHLDLEAIEQLEAALGHFDGTVLLVTHDRRMAERFGHTRRWTVEDGRLSEAW